MAVRSRPLSVTLMVPLVASLLSTRRVVVRGAGLRRANRESGALRREIRDGIVGRMSTKMIEQRLADLQKRVEALEIQLKPAPKGTWREAIGFAKDDELFDEAMRLGAEWRAKANREGR